MVHFSRLEAGVDAERHGRARELVVGDVELRGVFADSNGGVGLDVVAYPALAKLTKLRPDKEADIRILRGGLCRGFLLRVEREHGGRLREVLLKQVADGVAAKRLFKTAERDSAAGDKPIRTADGSGAALRHGDIEPDAVYIIGDSVHSRDSRVVNKGRDGIPAVAGELTAIDRGIDIRGDVLTEEAAGDGDRAALDRGYKAVHTAAVNTEGAGRIVHVMDDAAGDGDVLKPETAVIENGDAVGITAVGEDGAVFNIDLGIFIDVLIRRTLDEHIRALDSEAEGVRLGRAGYVQGKAVEVKDYVPAHGHEDRFLLRVSEQRDRCDGAVGNGGDRLIHGGEVLVADAGRGIFAHVELFKLRIEPRVRRFKVRYAHIREELRKRGLISIGRGDEAKLNEKAVIILKVGVAHIGERHLIIRLGGRLRLLRRFRRLCGFRCLCGFRSLRRLRRLHRFLRRGRGFRLLRRFLLRLARKLLHEHLPRRGLTIIRIRRGARGQQTDEHAHAQQRAEHLPFHIRFPPPCQAPLPRRKTPKNGDAACFAQSAFLCRYRTAVMHFCQ